MPVWRKDIPIKESKHGERTGMTKGRKIGGTKASGGWWQDVRKHECVKLGYPDVAREAAGSQSPHSSDEAP